MLQLGVISPVETVIFVTLIYYNMDSLINKAELSRLLKTSRKITNTSHPRKHNDKIQELNDLLEYWKRRHNL